ncbi:hypothetical protein AVEN_102589-1 [Araneus ventricosus]|uniref:Uncharacterized protein n=1 Tax=Araneus ventricosus TaxID=182803 RepID=A0A4Y2BKX3_ARAVE|nr:hypothetical protein AVEN_102589-1 [Araneus ventricosus]
MGARYRGKWNPKMLADYFLDIENGYSSSQAQSTGQVDKKVKHLQPTDIFQQEAGARMSEHFAGTGLQAGYPQGYQERPCGSALIF